MNRGPRRGRAAGAARSQRELSGGRRAGRSTSEPLEDDGAHMLQELLGADGRCWWRWGESNSRPEPFSGDHNERVRWFVLDRPNGHRHPAGRSSHVPLDRACLRTTRRLSDLDAATASGIWATAVLDGSAVTKSGGELVGVKHPAVRRRGSWPRGRIRARACDPLDGDDGFHIDADAWHEGPPSRPQLDYSVASLRARPVFARVKDSIASRHNTMNPPCGGWRTRSARTGWPRDAGSTASTRRPSSLPRWLAAPPPRHRSTRSMRATRES